MLKKSIGRFTTETSYARQATVTESGGSAYRVRLEVIPTPLYLWSRTDARAPEHGCSAGNCDEPPCRAATL